MALSRRGFVKAAAGAAGGLFFSDVLRLHRIARMAGGSALDPISAEVDPNFLMAEIRSIQGDTISALTGDLAIRMVRVSSQTRIWRTDIVSLSDLQVGDVFYARGNLDDEGYLLAESIWANIVNFSGSVSLGGDGSSGELVLPDRRIYHVHFAHNAEVVLGNQPASMPSQIQSREFEAAQVLGMWDERTRTLEVTRFWA